MSVIETSGSIRPGTTNIPLDQRSRVSTLAEISSIELPYLGQIVFCLETQKYYQITGLKSKLIGVFTVQDAAVDTYEAIPVTAAEIEDLVLKTVPRGQQGAVFTPSVDSDGNLSWTNNGELENPATVNIKGEKGDGITLRREWAEDKSYVPGDAVTYQGSLYIAYGYPGKGEAPNSPDDHSWQLCAEKGRTPEKWVDYWTEEDMLVFKDYVNEAILNGEW